MDEQGGHGGVHAAREPADHAAVADLGADALDLLGDDRLGAPRAVAAADVLEEAHEDLRAVGRVDDLGVELDAVDPPVDVLERGHGRLARRRERGEARRRREHRVAVRHPAGLLLGQAAEQAPALAVELEVRTAELPHLGALDVAAQAQHDRLHPVADAQHGDPELEQLGIELGGARRVDGRGPAGEDEPLGGAPADLLGADVVGQQLGEHPALAHPAGDELGVLAPVVEDHDLVGRQRPLRGELGERLVGRQRGAGALGREASRLGHQLPRPRGRRVNR